MATYVFDGSQSLNIASFDPQNDTVVIENFDVADVASFTQTNSSVQLTLNDGTVLSLGGVIFASLSDANFSTGSNSDVDIAFAPTAGGSATGNILIGSSGTDTLTPTTDDAIIYGQQGVDTINGDTFTGLRIFAGQGADFVTISGGLVFGNNGADEITLNVASGDTATVFGGSDVVGTADGNDTIDGNGSAGNLLIYGNAGDDTLIGGTGDDTIFGGADNDSIVGTAGDNMLYGNVGNDTIIGGTGADTILGGQDNDLLIVGSGEHSAYGNLGNDVIAFNGLETVLVHGGAGDDSIGALDLAGDFDPTAFGAIGSGSVVYGGLGDDVIRLEVSLTDGTAVTTIYGGNNIVGAADGDDSITVSGDGNVAIYGNLGNDTIVGGAGDTTIMGGQGNDSLTGGSAEGNVTMITGGEGNDIFVAGTVTTALVAGNDIGYSVVTDFTKGADTIEFSTDPTAFATVVVGAATSFDSVQGVITAYQAQIGANGALAVVVQSGDLAGETVLLHATTAGTADQVIVLTGAQTGLDLSDFT